VAGDRAARAAQLKGWRSLRRAWMAVLADTQTHPNATREKLAVRAIAVADGQIEKLARGSALLGRILKKR